jgi:hypothetical protein
LNVSRQPFGLFVVLFCALELLLLRLLLRNN